MQPSPPPAGGGAEDDVLSEAVRLHQNGQARLAEQAYLRVLAEDPKNANALHLLGVLAHQKGESERAATLIREAIAIEPGAAVFHINLANILMSRQDFAAAVEAYRVAVALAPNTELLFRLAKAAQRAGQFGIAMEAYGRVIEADPTQVEAYFNLGVVLQACGRLEKAEANFRRATDLQPEVAATHNALGLLMLGLSRFDEAEANFRSGLTVLPGSVEMATNLGHALRGQGRLAEAIASYQAALYSSPQLVEALTGLGAALGDIGEFQAAEAALQTAVSLKPADRTAQLNLGIIYYERNLLDEAARCYREVLAIDPNNAKAHSHLANIYQEQGDLEAAEASRKRALVLDQNQPEAHFGMAFLLLLRGEWRRGLAEYEWRWRCRRFAPTGHPFAAPLWNGAAAPGCTVLVYAEQGLGDTIQFVRFLPEVQLSGARVILCCQPELKELLMNVNGADDVLSTGDDMPAYDFQLPLMSLPHVLNLTQEAIRPQLPYLTVKGMSLAKWKLRLPESPEYRIGLVWTGNPAHRMNSRRSLAIDQLAPLMALPGVRFYALQKGAGALAAANPPPGIAMEDLSPQLETFNDTAAAISRLDLILTVDTAVAHLTGALGRPVWIMLPDVPDWRWGSNGEKSSWYPTARLFRQPRAGDWDSVVNEVGAGLRAMLRKRATAATPPGIEASPPA